MVVKNAFLCCKYRIKIQETTELPSYYNIKKNFVYIPYICVRSDYQGHGIARQLIDYIVSQLASHVYEMYLEVRKDNKGALHLYKKLGFYEIEDRGLKYLMKKEIQKISV